MSIHDFHSKLTTCSSNEAPVLDTLRRLSMVENLHSLLEDDEVTSDWGMWSDLAPTGAH
jgi:hypothetical protein